jgi:hypothetical protein
VNAFKCFHCIIQNIHQPMASNFQRRKQEKITVFFRKHQPKGRTGEKKSYDTLYTKMSAPVGGILIIVALALVREHFLREKPRYDKRQRKKGENFRQINENFVLL